MLTRPTATQTLTPIQTQALRIKPSRLKSMGELVLLVLLLLGMAAATLQLTTLDKDNMRPTFAGSERIVLSKLTFALRAPQRGEIVALINPQNANEVVVRRVVGLPGERVELLGGQVLINGRPLRESYIVVAQTNLSTPRDPSKQTVLRASEYYLLSDNRITGIDSRDWGSIQTNQLTGRAILVYFPFNALQIIRAAKYD